MALCGVQDGHAAYGDARISGNDRNFVGCGSVNLMFLTKGMVKIPCSFVYQQASVFSGIYGMQPDISEAEMNVMGLFMDILLGCR